MVGGVGGGGGRACVGGVVERVVGWAGVGGGLAGAPAAATRRGRRARLSRWPLAAGRARQSSRRSFYEAFKAHLSAGSMAASAEYKAAELSAQMRTGWWLRVRVHTYRRPSYQQKGKLSVVRPDLYTGCPSKGPDYRESCSSEAVVFSPHLLGASREDRLPGETSRRAGEALALPPGAARADPAPPTRSRADTGCPPAGSRRASTPECQGAKRQMNGPLLRSHERRVRRTDTGAR